MRLAPVAFIVSCLLAGAAHAGSVAVSFSGTPRFSDAGDTFADEQANRLAIAQYIESLGARYLPAQQTLKLEIVDIDLAGEIRHPRRAGWRELRVAKGGADFPRMTVRYTLESGGQVLRSGEETISDMDYTHHVAQPRASEPLHFEKRMLDEWFRTRFARE
jgi:hypothetical protein